MKYCKDCKHFYSGRFGDWCTNSKIVPLRQWSGEFKMVDINRQRSPVLGRCKPEALYFESKFTFWSWFKSLFTDKTNSLGPR